MSIIKGTIAAAAVITCCLGNELPAYSAPATCAVMNVADNFLETFACDYSMRINANGHKVNDIVFFINDERNDVSIIFWKSQDGNPEYAEVFINGERTAMQYYRAKNGALCVSNNKTQLCIV